MIGDTIRFRHPQTGEVREGIHTRDWPERNAVGVYVLGHREVVVHRDNVLESQPTTTTP